MKRFIHFFIGVVFLSVPFALTTKAQDFYPISSGEMILSFADVEQYGTNIPVNPRFTLFFHYGQYWHYNIGNHLGLFSGGAIRNVGFITNEDNYKVKRRSYTLGVPLAIKVGSFNNHVYFFAGAEYELLFHYKQKIFVNNSKIKKTEWFSNRTQRFLPSMFAGFQFPKGYNIKFKYYLKPFLNKDFRGFDLGLPVDYSSFDRTRIFYFSLSKQIRISDFKKNSKEEFIANVEGN